MLVDVVQSACMRHKYTARASSTQDVVVPPRRMDHPSTHALYRRPWPSYPLVSSLTYSSLHNGGPVCTVDTHVPLLACIRRDVLLIARHDEVGWFIRITIFGEGYGRWDHKAHSKCIIISMCHKHYRPGAFGYSLLEARVGWYPVQPADLRVSCADKPINGPLGRCSYQGPCSRTCSLFQQLHAKNCRISSSPCKDWHPRNLRVDQRCAKVPAYLPTMSTCSIFPHQSGPARGQTWVETGRRGFFLFLFFNLLPPSQPLDL